jgi:peptidoglycan hydrolase-like protein with peptidoglycan-binding domain
MHRYLITGAFIVGLAVSIAPAVPLDAQEAQAAAETERDRVRRVQEALIQFGYKPGPPDGAMGGRTRRAIRYYQGDHGLAVDGKITPELLEHIDQSLSARDMKPAPDPTTAPVAKTPAAAADEQAAGDASVTAPAEAAEEAPPAAPAEAPKDGFIQGLARGITGLFGGASSDHAGGSTATIGIRGLSKEGLKTAQPNPAELAKLDQYRAGAEQARAYANEKKLAARAVPYLPETKAGRSETSNTLPSGGR